MTGITFYRAGTIICMASYALFMKCIRQGRHVFITDFSMALSAIVYFIIVKVVMTVQTVQKIRICVGLMGEQNLAGIILKHQSNWFGRGRW
jgi:hypothetical protein